MLDTIFSYNEYHSISIDNDTIPEFEIQIGGHRFFGGEKDDYTISFKPLNSFEILIDTNGVIVDSTGYDLSDSTIFPVQTIKYDHYPEFLSEGFRIDNQCPFGSGHEYYLFYKDQFPTYPEFPWWIVITANEA